MACLSASGRFAIAFATMAFVSMTAASAAAAPILITSEGALTVDGIIDWGPLGPDGTVISDPFVINSSIPGLSATVSGSDSASFVRRNQGENWDGNFGPGETLLRRSVPGPLSMSFNGALLEGIGAQIQRNEYGAFTATIEAFDALDQSLGVFNLAGNSSDSGGDDSAIFIGLLDPSGQIARVEFNVQGGSYFAINNPVIQLATTTVPEPATLVTWGALTGVAMAAGAWKRRRMAMKA